MRFLREARRVLAPVRSADRVRAVHQRVQSARSTVCCITNRSLGTRPINLADSLPRPRNYFAAQGNATRLFFQKEMPGLARGLESFSRRSVQLLPLLPLRRLQQTGAVSGKLAAANSAHG